jgi:hypothetical protein
MATTTIKNGFGNGSDAQLLVNPDGSINVNSSGGGGTSNVNISEVGGNTVTTSIPVTIEGVNPNQNSVLIFNSETAVPVGISTTVATYTAPASPVTACLLLVSVSGTNVAQWTITNSSSGIYDQNYTSAAQLNEYFTFETGSSIVPGQIIGAGNTITVSVNQIGNSSGNFNARIQVLEIG